jgi:hypothetical protein
MISCIREGTLGADQQASMNFCGENIEIRYVPYNVFPGARMQPFAFRPVIIFYAMTFS